MSVCFIDPNKVEQVRHAINSDPEFKLAGKFFTKDILFVYGDSRSLVRIRDGIITEIKPNPTFMDSWSFFIRASSESWEKFLQPVPPPFFTDLYGAISRQNFELGGDLESAFAHFWPLTRLLAILRELHNETAPGAMHREEKREWQDVEPITGKYLHFKVQGIEYRVYVEQNGQGIPLLCMHTAASDGRLWRHALNDDDITSRYQVIVPDLPYHGKSLPPESVEWWKEEYRLTKKFFMDFHVALSRALGLERPVYMGCSIGGKLAVDLALEYPDVFRAVIGLEAGLSRVKRSPVVDFHNHPRISNEFKVQAMYGKTAPGNPEKYRREIAWTYGQSAPFVFKGDLYYNIDEYNVTTTRVQEIDTSRIAVYLLSGEYDWGNPPEDTRKLAEQIKGAKFVEMKGLGHFPMSENFEVFKGYVMPILNEIADHRR